jgi:hypothetical protein
MRLHQFLWCLPLLALAACNPITPADVHRVRVCKTKHSKVRNLFGSPDEIGKMGDMITWRYQDGMNRNKTTLLVAFNQDSIVVDLVHNPVGLVQLQDRCVKKAE